MTTQPHTPTPSVGTVPTPAVAANHPTEAILDDDGVGIRAPSHSDGAILWDIARRSGALDLNSPYAYMMACRNFQATSAIADVYGRPAGFVTAHRLPAKPDTLFIWQVAVLDEFQGRGIAKRLLDDLIAREANAGVRVLEATVTPSNAASKALFQAFATAHGATLSITPAFSGDDFPDGSAHEAEDLFTIAPVRSVV